MARRVTRQQLAGLIRQTMGKNAAVNYRASTKVNPKVTRQPRRRKTPKDATPPNG